MKQVIIDAVQGNPAIKEDIFRRVKDKMSRVTFFDKVIKLKQQKLIIEKVLKNNKILHLPEEKELMKEKFNIGGIKNLDEDIKIKFHVEHTEDINDKVIRLRSM